MPTLQQLYQQFQTLQTAFNKLQSIVYLHKHLGSDYTQKLNTTTSSVGIYSGQVSDSGSTSGLFPSSWSVSYNSSTYRYTITHNLGVDNTVVATAGPGTFDSQFWVGLYSQTNNEVVIQGFQAQVGGGTVAGPVAFSFIVSTS